MTKLQPATGRSLLEYLQSLTPSQLDRPVFVEEYQLSDRFEMMIDDLAVSIEAI